jgi:hypothetical protein
MKKICFAALVAMVSNFSTRAQTNIFPSTGNAKIFAVSQNWNEGIAIVSSSGWAGVRLTRNDPASGNYNGNWAIGYNGSTGNDFSLSTNYNGTQYDGVFHISNSTRNVGIGTTSPSTTLQIMDANSGGPTGTTTPNQGLLISGNGTGGSLNLGIDATGSGNFYSWIQSRHRTNNSVYTLALNPSGGNVGIGTTAPSNTQGWDKVLNIDGAGNSKMIASSSGQNFRAGVYSHSTWNGTGGGVIGTETNHKLFFMTNYTTQATLDVNGYLGMGVTSPASMVHINSAVERNTFRIYKNTSTANYLSIWQGTGAAALDPIGTGKLYLGYDQTTDTYVNGKLGIGTTQPDYPLTVNGSIHAKEVRVDLNVPAPDYVFEKEYVLTSLDDIKVYIDQNKHLPEVPSATEMEKNGVQLGEMNMILLKKIEELTLLMIQMKEENTEMKKEINDLKSNK